ncbi:MAG: metal-dependent transcriptional regulator [Candidatus Omnitrophica bacterium]|nr:metal-dependent transcriptional regulator [Candidatus Omnitrophota bacterium]MCF7878653.1 metal-dependent transcriptional regulator [Candidatus Omnitrophota bacterium]MCF7892598.1 metal-dependent transcriptional regulator [Candidatus Omnitrophota bacterium]
MTQTISSNMEDYLEAIIFLKEKKEIVRVKDIGKELGVKNPSVSEALGILSKKGLVKHKRYGNVELTKKGDKLAKTIARRHNTLVKFLKEVLKIDQKTASQDACRMEHSISKGTAKKLNNFINFIENSPYSGRPQWLKSFDNFEKTGKRLNCRIRKSKIKND